MGAGHEAVVHRNVAQLESSRIVIKVRMELLLAI